jgi:hypothetical protein
MNPYIPDNAEITMFYQQLTEALTMAAIDEQRRIIQLLEPYRYTEISVGKLIELIEGK